MTEIPFVLCVLGILLAAAFGARAASVRLRDHHRSEETNAIVRLIAGLFVVMTSLVFGLVINSSRASFDSLQNQVETYAAHLILMDRSLAVYGPDARDTRTLLADYVSVAIENPARVQQDHRLRDHGSEDRLAAVALALNAIVPENDQQAWLIASVRDQYQHILEQRWTIIETGHRTLPVQLAWMLVAWLALIFASFGYRALVNAVVDVAFVVSALLMSGSLYLVLDMNLPFSGVMQVSDLPLRQALAELRRTGP